MTAKKRWLSKNCEELNNKNSTSHDLDISWSSSSSEKECNTTKKFKISNQKFYFDRWIKTNQNYEESQTSSNNVVCNGTSDENSVTNSSFLTCEAIRAEDCCDKPSASSSHNFEVSPIIGRVRLGQISPVLLCSQHIIPSPVIGTNGVEKVKRRIKNNRLKEPEHNPISEYSSQLSNVALENDSFSCSQVIGRNRRYNVKRRITQRSISTCSTQQSNKINENNSFSSRAKMETNTNSQLKSRYSTQSDTVIENGSPTSTQNTNVFILSEESFHTSPQYLIDPFPSQKCLEEISSGESAQIASNSSTENTAKTLSGKESIIITESTETSSSKSSGCEPLYYDAPPKMKKKYKKNGLADQLQKAIHKQKMDFSIWRHELYLNKSKGCEALGSFADNLLLLLKVTTFWKEFGVTIVECEHIKEQNVEETTVQNETIDSVTQEINDAVNDIDLKKCLVIIGFNVTHAVRIKINAKFKLCMPYRTKVVKYNSGFIFCHFNISKLLSFK